MLQDFVSFTTLRSICAAGTFAFDTPSIGIKRPISAAMIFLFSTTQVEAQGVMPSIAMAACFKMYRLIWRLINTPIQIRPLYLTDQDASNVIHKFQMTTVLAATSGTLLKAFKGHYLSHHRAANCTPTQMERFAENGRGDQLSSRASF
jgi:hypothetical protein